MELTRILDQFLNIHAPILRIFQTTDEMMCFSCRVQELCAPQLCPPARSRCDACANRFTALRAAQLPSPLFLATIKAPAAPALTSEAVPASPAGQSAPRPLGREQTPGQERGDVPRGESSSAVRPSVLCQRGEASEMTVRVCDPLQAAAAGCGLPGQQRDKRVKPARTRQNTSSG